MEDSGEEPREMRIELKTGTGTLVATSDRSSTRTSTRLKRRLDEKKIIERDEWG